jgi:hypothetical protein
MGIAETRDFCFSKMEGILVSPVMATIQFSGNPRGSGVSGRLFGTVFFLIFFGMGLLFVVLVGREVIQRAETYRWPAVRCTILSSGVLTDNSSETPYRFSVRYQYDVGGNVYRSERPALSNVRSGSYGDVLRMAENYPADSQTICYANPKNPSQAVLWRNSLWFALMLVIPLPFILIGALGMIAMWTPWKSSATSVGTISKKATISTSTGCQGLFFGVFLLAGLAFLTIFFVRPIFKIREARHWPATPCRIISSEVRSHRGDESTTYSVDVLYSYEVAGREYKANRYSFTTGSSSGYAGKAAVVARYARGSMAVCYVNPVDAMDVVLERGLTPDLWFGLIPGSFVAVGVGGLVYSARQRRRAAGRETVNS